MSARCLGRLTKWSSKRPFGDGKHYFTLEFRCKRDVDEGCDLCSVCLERPESGKFQDRILHGKITDPIPDVSYVYGGPRYIEYVKRFGEPSEEHVAAAIEAHKLVIEGYADIEMAKEGRKKKKPAGAAAGCGGSGSGSGGSAHQPSKVVAACAIEVSERPILIEVEHVTAQRIIIDGKCVVVDSLGRMWDVDEKGFPVKFRGLTENALKVRSDT